MIKNIFSKNYKYYTVSFLIIVVITIISIIANKQPNIVVTKVSQASLDSPLNIINKKKFYANDNATVLSTDVEILHYYIKCNKDNLENDIWFNIPENINNYYFYFSASTLDSNSVVTTGYFQDLPNDLKIKLPLSDKPTLNTGDYLHLFIAVTKSGLVENGAYISKDIDKAINHIKFTFGEENIPILKDYNFLIPKNGLEEIIFDKLSYSLLYQVLMAVLILFGFIYLYIFLVKNFRYRKKELLSELKGNTIFKIGLVVIGAFSAIIGFNNDFILVKNDVDFSYKEIILPTIDLHRIDNGTMTYFTENGVNKDIISENGIISENDNNLENIVKEKQFLKKIKEKQKDSLLKLYDNGLINKDSLFNQEIVINEGVIFSDHVNPENKNIQFEFPYNYLYNLSIKNNSSEIFNNPKIIFSNSGRGVLVDWERISNRDFKDWIPPYKVYTDEVKVSIDLIKDDELIVQIYSSNKLENFKVLSTNRTYDKNIEIFYFQTYTILDDYLTRKIWSSRFLQYLIFTFSLLGIISLADFLRELIIKSNPSKS